MFCHMVVILAASTVIFILRVVPQLEEAGDQAHRAFRLIPSYSIATALYTDASIEFVSQVRNTTDGEGVDISPDPWEWDNNLMDLILQFYHFFFWSFILFLVEADLFKRCRKCWQRCFECCFSPKPRQDLKLDSDVIAENKRVKE